MNEVDYPLRLKFENLSFEEKLEIKHLCVQQLLDIMNQSGS